MPTPAIGTLAPDFDLAADNGTRVRLSELRGRPVVLYFYPRDNTSGCTTEACDFRDREPQWRGQAGTGAVVLGVSGDSVESHAKFKAKFGLPFLLLADPSHQMMETYGAWGEKTLYGKKSLGTIRSTLLIDRDGKVAAAWPKVTVNGHVDKVLEALKKLG
ncbi:MAG: peroxiredoxin [Myxococcota bacterium]